MTQPRLCLGGCGRILPRGSRCSECAIPREGNTAAKRARHTRILERDNYRCSECACDLLSLDSKQRHVDHITPLSKGGTDADDNLVAMCGPCNARKRDHLTPPLTPTRAFRFERFGTFPEHAAGGPENH